MMTWLESAKSWFGAHAEKCIHADGVQVGQQRRQFVDRLERGNAVQLRLQRRKAQPC